MMEEDADSMLLYDISGESLVHRLSGSFQPSHPPALHLMSITDRAWIKGAFSTIFLAQGCPSTGYQWIVRAWEILCTGCTQSAVSLPSVMHSAPQDSMTS